ncbi:MAG: hypothetical protein ABMA25_13830 [Ilumatobacteraceae bacterium]
MISSIRRALAVLAALIAFAAPLTVHAADSSPGNLAWFEDHWIDLSVDWEEATACDVGTNGTVCYRTEQLLNAAVWRASSTTSGVGILALSCASAVRLYDGISYTGNVLNLSTRQSIINLSGYGFDNVTTSYKVGACDAEFYSGANFGGSAYPGNTSASAQSASMASGWNNLVSSVYIF